ncbi:MAG: DUF3883 domain-containing protein [Brooklawnia sp.]|jgi:hypothetical protein
MAEKQGTPWTDSEVETVVESYFRMFEAQLTNTPYVKVRENEWVRERTGRSKGSVERKYQNVSAVLMKLSAGDFVRGYVPLSNYQAKLEPVVEQYLQQHRHIEAQMLANAETPVSLRPDFVWNVTEPPKATTLIAPGQHRARTAIKTDFVRLEAYRRDLGKAGELAVVQLERKRLRQRGQTSLAERVEHVSQTQGDGLGFDILSFDQQGDEKYIEVKTTRQPKQYPFLVTSNELDFSREVPEQFHLYRVFELEAPKIGLFELPGPLDESCALEPKLYSAVPSAHEE